MKKYKCIRAPNNSLGFELPRNTPARPSRTQQDIGCLRRLYRQKDGVDEPKPEAENQQHEAGEQATHVSSLDASRDHVTVPSGSGNRAVGSLCNRAIVPQEAAWNVNAFRTVHG